MQWTGGRRGGRAARVVRVTAVMRPYTVRKGDTLATIASKRGMSVEEIRKTNAGRKMDAEVKVGETILLPSGKLSKRDDEIIEGITKINQPRVYPTRKGETIMDIISARNISFDDVKKLNPGVKLGTFQNGEKLKLPPGKYTVREKEMLQGCGILPAETVNPFKVLVHPNSLIVLAAVTMSGRGRVQSPGSMVQGPGSRVQGPGSRV